MAIRIEILSTVVVAQGIVLVACGAEPRLPTSPMALSDGGVVPRCSNVVWSADHETGDLSQWYLGAGGGEFNSGAAVSGASQDVAHSGRYSAKATIDTRGLSGDSGVRLFRWDESRAHLEACYGAWFYFPERYAVPVWWNVFQFKSRSGRAANDAFWSLQVGNRPGDAMYVYLKWGDQVSVEGPHRGEFGGRSYPQAVADIPVGRWTHIETYLRQSSDFDGQIVVWQDGVELFNLNNVRTRYTGADGTNEWSINNYSHSILPSPTVLYIDDATIRSATSGRPPAAAGLERSR